MKRASLLSALLFVSLARGGAARAESPPPATEVAPDEPAAPPAPKQKDARAKSTKRKLELDEIRIEGEAQKPSVMFVDGGREQLRRAMQGLLSETRTGGEVSSPRDRAPPVVVVERVVARGIDETAVRSRIAAHAAAFAGCGRGSPTAVRLSLRLVIDDGGRPRSMKILAAHPDDAKVKECAVRVARGLTFPAPAAGSGRVELTLVVPVSEATTTTGPAQDDARARRRSSVPSTRK